MKEQVLDSMDIERERGITMCSNCKTKLQIKNGKEYILNIIDTLAMLILAMK